MLIKNFKNEQGQLLIEFILAVGLMAILLTSGLNILGPSLKISSQSEEKEFVAALIQEQFEVIRSIRNENWSALAVNGTYHYEDIDEDEAGLTFLANPILYDNKYEVSIILDDVYRDSNMDILETGNLDQIDTNSRKVTVRVSWDSYGNEKIVSQSMYLTNWDDF